MVNWHEVGLAATGPINDRLAALARRVVNDAGASYVCLFLCGQGRSELRSAACFGRAEAPEGLPAVARLALSRGEAMYLQGEEDAKGAIGYGLSKGALPLICCRVTGGAAPCGVVVIGLTRSAGEDLSFWLLLLQSLVDFAGVCVEVEALQNELQAKEQQVRGLIKDTLDAQEGERERICLEVHDGVTQTLVSAFQHLQTVESKYLEGTPGGRSLLRAGALLRQAIQESREVVNSLQPASLRDLGLVATLRQELRQLEQESMGWKVVFIAPPPGGGLTRDMETGLYRIIREAITNARKHAETDRLSVSVTSTDERLKVEVKDWGKGFDYRPQDVSKRRGTGLLSMRRRAELLQGTFELESSPGHGTTIRVEIPISHEVKYPDGVSGIG